MPAGGSVVGVGGALAPTGLVTRLGGLWPAGLAMGGFELAKTVGFGSPTRGALSGAITGATATFAATGILSSIVPFSTLGLAMPFLLPALGIGALVCELIGRV